MKDNKKRPPVDPHNPHNPPPGDPECDCKKKKKKEKRPRRRRGPVLFLILIIVILLALIWFFRDGLGLGGDGKGTGSGSSTSDTSSDPSSDISSGQAEDITEIRIDDKVIYIGSERCTDENDLKEKIIAAGKGKKYVYIHETAIKETHEKVKAVLLDLRDALELDIDFNE